MAKKTEMTMTKVIAAPTADKVRWVPLTKREHERLVKRVRMDMQQWDYIANEHGWNGDAHAELSNDVWAELGWRNPITCTHERVRDVFHDRFYPCEPCEAERQKLGREWENAREQANVDVGSLVLVVMNEMLNELA